MAADLASIRGRPPPLGTGKRLEQAVPRSIKAQRATGVLTTACRYKEIQRKTGNPKRLGRVTPIWTPATDRPGRLGRRLGSYYRRSRATPVEGRSLVQVPASEATDIDEKGEIKK